MRRYGVILAGLGILAPAYAQTVTVSPRLCPCIWERSINLPRRSRDDSHYRRLDDCVAGRRHRFAGHHQRGRALYSAGRDSEYWYGDCDCDQHGRAHGFGERHRDAAQSVSDAGIRLVRRMLPSGPSRLTMNGSGFVPGAQVLFGGVPLATTYVSATRLTATGTATGAQSGQQIPVDGDESRPGLGNLGGCRECADRDARVPGHKVALQCRGPFSGSSRLRARRRHDARRCRPWDCRLI